MKGGRRQGRQRKRWKDRIREWTGLEFSPSPIGQWRTGENGGNLLRSGTSVNRNVSPVPKNPMGRLWFLRSAQDSAQNAPKTYTVKTGVSSAQGHRLRHHHQHHLSLNRKGHWGTTDDFTTSFLRFPLFCTALWDLANSRPVHSLMLFPPLPLSALSSSPFHRALQDGFG